MKVSVSGQRKVACAVAAVYLAAHAMYLAPSLEDIDSINFALGLRNFDPAQHQPHPPGSPVYIALGRVVLACVSVVQPGLDQIAADALTLAVLSLAAGVVAIVASAELFALVAPRRRYVTTWGVALLAASPLFWLSGLRPMSDLPGLAAALVSQVLILQGRIDRRRLVYGALASGVAAGIRVQTVCLTVPLLLLALASQRAAGVRWLLTRPMAAMALGTLAWAVPLVADSGGVAGYLEALGTQAGEDFAWVDMLWRNPTPRRLAFALYETFVLPWSVNAVATAIALAAMVGVSVAWFRDRGTVALLLLAFGPYAAFQLLFQETLTVRYALPTLVPVAWLVARALATTGRFVNLVAVPLVISILVVSVPVGPAYGGEAHPAFRAIAAALEQTKTEQPAAVYAHYSLWRALQAQTGLVAEEPRRQYEWLGPVDYWRDGGTRPVWFLADPHRTDMALIDPIARQDVRRFVWAVADRRELSGARPRGADWYRISPPGWFVGEGWSLTPETGGLAAATGAGPSLRPIEAWVRRRPGALHLVIGGRHLGRPGDSPAAFELAIDGEVADRWTAVVGERNFLRFLNLPDGVAEGPGPYARLTVASRALDGAGRRAPTAVRQFDIQPASRILHAFGEGWHEAEYDRISGQLWRWTSERSILHVKGAVDAVRITLRGPSPRSYLDAIPTLRVVVGGRVAGQLRPETDFEWAVTVSAEDLKRAAGAIAIETDPVYLPGSSEHSTDDRHLGLRMYETRVESLASD